MFNTQIKGRTIIPKNGFVRPGFFEKFYYNIVNETQNEYWLELNTDKIKEKKFDAKGVEVKEQAKVYDKLHEFSTYLNHTLNPGDWIPFVFNKNIIDTKILIFSRDLHRKLNLFPIFY